MQATATSKWMEGMTDYIKYGYVPYDRCGTSASNTLEYAYDDWTIYQAALDAGDKEMAETFKKRALNYKNVFNPELGLACPKYKDGSWKKNFSPLQTYGEGFIEGNSANYSFHVPHDVKGMIECFGGDKKFIQRLDNLFAEPLDKKYYEDNEDIEEECLLGGYVHGNEPSPRNHEPHVRQQHRWPARQRRLWTDVGLVHLHGYGLLSRLSWKRPVCAWSALCSQL